MHRWLHDGLLTAGVGVLVPAALACVGPLWACDATSASGAFLATGFVGVGLARLAWPSPLGRGLLLGGGLLVSSWVLAAVIATWAARAYPNAASSVDTDTFNRGQLQTVSALWALAMGWPMSAAAVVSYGRQYRSPRPVQLVTAVSGLALVTVGVCAGGAPWGVMDPAADCALRGTELLGQVILYAIPMAIALGVLVAAAPEPASS
jgi:hypothetical protein